MKNSLIETETGSDDCLGLTTVFVDGLRLLDAVFNYEILKINPFYIRTYNNIRKRAP